MSEKADKQRDLEWARFEFDRDKFDREQKVREAELELKRTDQNRSGFKSPLFVGIVIAAITLFGNIAATIYNGYVEREKISAQSELENRRAQASLVLEAVKTGDPDVAAENLAFLLDAQLIDDDDGTLTKYLKSREPGTGIFLPGTGPQQGFTDPPNTTEPGIEVFASRARCEATRKTQPKLARSPDTELRVATWNLEFLGLANTGPGSSKDFEWLACSLAWMDVDVVAIQEIEGRGEPEAALQILTDLLAAGTGHRWVSVLQSCSQRQMLGFLVKVDAYQILSSRDVWYLNARAENESEACSGLRPGVALQLQAVETPGSKDYAHQVVTLVNIHADAGTQEGDYASRQKLRSTFNKLLSDATVASSDHKLIVLGDFNAIGRVGGPSAAEEVAEFKNAFGNDPTRPLHLMTTGETCTYIYQDRCVAIDHIAVDASFENSTTASANTFGYCTIAKRFGIQSADLASREFLSDHCPVVVDLDL